MKEYKTMMVTLTGLGLCEIVKINHRALLIRDDLHGELTKVPNMIYTKTTDSVL